LEEVAKSVGRVNPEEVREHLNEILESDAFSGSGVENDYCRSVIQVLCDRWKPSGAVPLIVGSELLKQMAERFALHDLRENDPTWPVRNAIDKIRDELLPAYYAANPHAPIRFTIPLSPKGTRGWKLTILRQRPMTVTADYIRLFLRRNEPGNPFEEIVCSPSEVVLFMSIASVPAYYEHIEPWFQERRIRARHFRVLTWRPPPQSERMIEAAADTFGQDKGSLKGNIDLAWERWKSLELEILKDKHAPRLEVYAYHVFPTALAIYNDDAIKVEFLPFNPKGGARSSTNHPQILINAADYRRAYDYFRGWFDDIWFRSMHATLADERLDAEVHPYWRDRRKPILQARGLIPKP